MNNKFESIKKKYAPGSMLHVTLAHLVGYKRLGLYTSTVRIFDKDVVLCIALKKINENYAAACVLCRNQTCWLYVELSYPDSLDSCLTPM